MSVLRDHVPDTKTLQAIAADLTKVEEEIKTSKEVSPRGKTRLVAFIRADDPKLASLLQAGAYIVQVPDGAEDGGDLPEAATYTGEALLQRLRVAAVAHNDERPKRRGKPRVKVETWHQLFSHLKAKTLKESGSKVTIKAGGMPVEVIPLVGENVQLKGAS